MKNEHFPRIEKPCSKKWDSLAGTGSKKFCGDCQLHVHNLSEMSACERSDFLQNAGHQCIAYVETPKTWKADIQHWKLLNRFRLLSPLGVLLAMVAAIIHGACASYSRKTSPWGFLSLRRPIALRPPLTKLIKSPPRKSLLETNKRSISKTAIV